MKFTVKKNRHWFLPLLIRMWFGKPKDLKYTICFTEDCWYDPASLPGINKLFGFTFGLFGIHKNSVRFGWKPGQVKGLIGIFAYWYEGGVRMTSYICGVKTNTDYVFSIVYTKKTSCFKIQNEELGAEKHILYAIRKSKIGFYLYPYFGGIFRAPWPMSINFKNFNRMNFNLQNMLIFASCIALGVVVHLTKVFTYPWEIIPIFLPAVFGTLWIFRRMRKKADREKQERMEE
jgi:hypothetical protein